MKRTEKLLLIDITSEVGKVCLNDDCFTWQAQGNAEVVLEKVDALLKKHRIKICEITAIQVNPGPGSFTGTRVGVAVANALRWSLGKGRPFGPVYGSQPKINLPK